MKVKNRKRFLIILCTMVLVWWRFTCAGPREAERIIENYSFGVGERLDFSVNYGVINAGSATMEVRGFTEIRGRPCYHAISSAWSNSFFSFFFKVEDVVESFIDKDGIFPWRFEKHLREGKYKADEHIDFDQVNHLAMSPEDTVEVPSFVQDVLSTLYYTRTLKMEVGVPLFIDNHADGKNYPLKVLVHRRERIKVEAGVFECLVVEPKLEEEAGIFKHEGKLTVWLTDDRRKMPVLMKSKVFIGSISAELKRFQVGKFITSGEIENAK